MTLFLRDSVSEAHTIIQRTAALNQVPVEFTTSDKIFGSIDGSNDAYRTELRLGGLVVSNGKGSDKKACKDAFCMSVNFHTRSGNANY